MQDELFNTCVWNSWGLGAVNRSGRGFGVTAGHFCPRKLVFQAVLVSVFFLAGTRSPERMRVRNLDPWDFFLWLKLYASNNQAHFNEKSTHSLEEFKIATLRNNLTFAAFIVIYCFKSWSSWNQENGYEDPDRDQHWLIMLKCNSFSINSEKNTKKFLGGWGDKSGQTYHN